MARSPPRTSPTNAAKAIAPPPVSWYQPGYAAVGRRSPGPYPDARAGNRAAAAFLPPVPLVERQRHHPRRHLGAAHVDGHVAVVPHVRGQERQGDAAVERGRVVAARHPPDRLAARRHGLVGPRRAPALHLEALEPALDAPLPLDGQGLAPPELALVPGHHPTEAGLQGRDPGSQLVAMEREPGL